MSTSIKTCRAWLERQKGKKQEIDEQIDSLKEEIEQNQRELKRYEKAREVIKLVGVETQRQLQYHIGDITSLALESVFPDPYKLELEFIERKNKTECAVFFVRDGMRRDPLSSSGIGAVDVATFALRVASWSMQNPQSRNVIILDEPMKNVSVEYQEKTSQMIKEISQKLNIQFIIVTHNQVLTSYADRIFTTKIKNRITTITQS